MKISRTVRTSIIASLVTLALVASWALVQPASARNTLPAPAVVTPTPLPQTGDGQLVTPSNRPVAAPDNGPDARSTANAPTVFFSYFRLVGTALNPRTSAKDFAYNSNCCFYKTGGTDDRFTAPLLIPEGSVIKYLRFYYDDTSSGNNLTAWITRYQPGISFEDLTSVTSITNTGYGTTLSPEITHTVDLTNWAYTVIVAANGNTISNTICGIRVAYYAPPIFGAFLPVIQKE
ncbi:MAG: hypothetical protein HY870_24525 [Chloroflexi bacterium]|nr:hypothetical protein [Chloroflexota bacterium]